ncbi:phage tail spike protein [Paenibacillaceae bacterium WGS1546]|uniref:phage tail protein n=1 Tax=Cohnella sp. WGS1546 TaxID=3366810 RepID=UPI00372D1A6B
MIKVYDQNMQLVAYLENAFTVSYETPFNSLWRASFSLPATDPKNEECRPLRYVELFDGDERLDLFRIIPSVARRSADGLTITYDCEHVLATLLDDVLFQFHTVGNLGYYTPAVLQYILTRQVVHRWKLGTVSFNRQFEYNWENENLLGALFSVPKPFVEEYQWTWDTTTTPWTLNLVEPSQEVEAYIRYGVNLRGIEKTTDPTNLCTRLFCLGYGEGVNQLTISDINGGRPYLDADTQSQYGVITRIWVDRRFTSPETLKARGEALLNESKHPRISYVVQAGELYALTNDPIDRFKTGTLVRVQDAEMGEDIVIRVVNKRKPNVFGAPGDVELEIANRPVDIAGSMADLANRQRIGEVYAQGATNGDTQSFADNCDPTHPAVIKFWVPEEAARINKVRLTYDVEAFRAYSRSIEAAPATSSGPSSATTTGASSITTTGASSITTTGPSSATTTTQVGVNNNTSTGVGWIEYETSFTNSNTMETVPDHNHGIFPGTQLRTADGGVVTWSASGGHQHRVGYHKHEFTSDLHSHGMDHTHNMPHTHDMPHTHNMPHTHTIPAHTHEIEHGIFEGPTPTTVTVKVDGQVVPGLGVHGEDIDIVQYLAKDGGGRIQRGTWHTIEIIPDNLGRIVASVFSQLFIQSRGGGDY